MLGSPRIQLQKALLQLPNAEPQDYAEQIADILALLRGMYRSPNGVDDATARELATGYGLWVRSIRTAEGAVPFPKPDEARAHPWSDEDRELVADRIETQFVGSPATVVDGLIRLRDATGADELVITTITHDHCDRVRSYELLAREWNSR